MSEWPSKKLREVIGRPISGSRPTGGVNTETEGIPSLGGENVLLEGGVTFANLNRVSEEFYKSMPKGHLQPFDVLINKDGAQTGKVGLYRGDFPEACVNEHLFILRNIDGAIDQRFLFYSVLLPRTQAKIARRITGSAQPGLNTTFVDAVDILVPMNFREQRRIAEIISTLDETIEQTKMLVQKWQQIKAGLMHDLFTRGVNSAGHLRPIRADAPHLYQSTPLGWIPNEWDSGQLSKFLVGGPKNGYSPQEVDEWSGLTALGLGCLTSEGFKPNHLKMVSNSSVACRDAVLTDGDLLLSRSNTRELVGLCGIYRDIGSPCIYPDLMMRIRPSAKTSARFLENLLLSPLMRLRITGAAVGTSGSMVKLNSRAVLRLKVAVPKPTEQMKILNIIDSQRMAIRTLEADIAKLRYKKQGLMQDLLMGHVRVKT
jgi:type I restriction enzyme S subunit